MQGATSCRPKPAGWGVAGGEGGRMWGCESGLKGDFREDAVSGWCPSLSGMDEFSPEVMGPLTETPEGPML